jgi:hypothetical protein
VISRRTTWVLAALALFTAAFGIPVGSPARPRAQYEIVYTAPRARRTALQAEEPRVAARPQRVPAPAAVSEYHCIAPAAIFAFSLFQRPPPAALLSRG